jgi:hypothetical protein
MGFETNGIRGYGSRKARMAHKKRRILRKIVCCKELDVLSLQRAQGFSQSLGV